MTIALRGAARAQGLFIERPQLAGVDTGKRVQLTHDLDHLKLMPPLKMKRRRPLLPGQHRLLLAECPVALHVAAAMHRVDDRGDARHPPQESGKPGGPGSSPRAPLLRERRGEARAPGIPCGPLLTGQHLNFARLLRAQGFFLRKQLRPALFLRDLQLIAPPPVILGLGELLLRLAMRRYEVARLLVDVPNFWERPELAGMLRDVREKPEKYEWLRQQ